MTENRSTENAAEKRSALDARMAGKWYKEEMGETINIFPEEPPRMKMSFSSSGHYNFEPNCVYTDGAALCWEINDEYYRMVYRVRYEDGRLCGVYTQFGRETPVVYERVSDTPEDGEYLYISPNEYVPGTKTTRRAILAEYTDYAPCDTVIPETTYALGGPGRRSSRNMTTRRIWMERKETIWYLPRWRLCAIIFTTTVR